MRWINGTQSSFSQTFFSVFILGYFLFHHRPLLFSKYYFANSTRTILAKGFLRENCSSVRSIHRSQRSFSESFFLLLIGGYFLFQQLSMGFQISLCKFHQNSLSERLLEKKAVTLWDELTEHKAGSQKASFQFLTEDISFFIIALYGLRNITLKIPQEQS